MKTHIDAQIIKQGGKPAFAVIPYQAYLELIESRDDDTFIPHEVVGLVLEKDLSLMAAWRRFKALSQAELARSMGISQAALAQMEKRSAKPTRKTLAKVARALGISTEQLDM